MKTVAVSLRVDRLPERGESRDAVDQRLLAFLRAAGCVAVPVPNLADAAALAEWAAAVSPQAVVLSGGNDVGACAERDATESWLLDHARERSLPVLGICRGMQMMAHWAGADLRPVRGHVRTRHRLSGEVRAEVNSYHDFAVADCPSGFAVLARSEDGEIEAMRHLALPWEGWMWHPEREVAFAPDDIARLRTLFGLDSPQ